MGVSYVHCVCPTVVAELCLPLVQSATMAFFASCGPGLVLCCYGVGLGMPWACSWVTSAVRPDACPQPIARTAGALHCKALSVLFSKRLLLVGRLAVKSDACPPTIYWGYHNTNPQGTLPILSPEKLLFVGRAGSQIRCLPLLVCWGYRPADQ